MQSKIINFSKNLCRTKVLFQNMKLIIRKYHKNNSKLCKIKIVTFKLIQTCSNTILKINQ